MQADQELAVLAGTPSKTMRQKTAITFMHLLGRDVPYCVNWGDCLMSDLSARDGRPARPPLVINRGVTIVGSLFYDGQIQVEGTIDGEVRCSALQITERGAVEGLIVAESVDVRGEANGSILRREASFADLVLGRRRGLPL